MKCTRVMSAISSLILSITLSIQTVTDEGNLIPGSDLVNLLYSVETFKQVDKDLYEVEFINTPNISELSFEELCELVLSYQFDWENNPKQGKVNCRFITTLASNWAEYKQAWHIVLMYPEHTLCILKWNGKLYSFDWGYDSKINIIEPPNWIPSETGVYTLTERPNGLQGQSYNNQEV